MQIGCCGLGDPSFNTLSPLIPYYAENFLSKCRRQQSPFVPRRVETSRVIHKSQNPRARSRGGRAEYFEYFTSPALSKCHRAGRTAVDTGFLWARPFLLILDEGGTSSNFQLGSDFLAVLIERKYLIVKGLGK